MSPIPRGTGYPMSKWMLVLQEFPDDGDNAYVRMWHLPEAQAKELIRLNPVTAAEMVLPMNAASESLSHLIDLTGAVISTDEDQ